MFAAIISMIINNNDHNYDLVFFNIFLLNIIKILYLRCIYLNMIPISLFVFCYYLFSHLIMFTIPFKHYLIIWKE